MLVEMSETEYETFKLVLDEFRWIKKRFKPYNSPHEAYGVLIEEVDELWDEIKKKEALRTPERLIEESIQIAAVALRFAYETKEKI